MSSLNIEVHKLPFVPQPYKDEVFGSWVERIRNIVGRGAWDPLIDRAGYNTKRPPALFDILDIDKRLEILLAGLGITYCQALRDMTTVQFWCAFKAIKDMSISGCEDLPLPSQDTNNKFPIQQLRWIGLDRATRSISRWYCPSCIAEDGDCGRQPYWRRSHQLITAFYCQDHLVPLRSSCDSCGASPLSNTASSWRGLSLECSCGVDRRFAESDKISENSNYQRMQNIGIETLSLEKITWDGATTRDAIRAIVASDKALHGLSAVEIIRRGFPGSWIEHSRYRMSLTPPGSARGLNVWHAYAASAPVLVALLAITGLSFNELIPMLQVEGSPADTVCNFVPENADRLGVLGARRVLGTNGPRLENTKCAYWYLRIHDHDWIKSRKGFRHAVMPSVKEDREFAIQEWGCGSKQIHPTHAVRLRMLIRDKAAFKLLLDKRAKISKGKQEEGLIAKNDWRRLAIESALSRIVESSERPQSISIPTLATRAGVGHVLTRRLVKSSPKLKKMLDEFNENAAVKRIEWTYLNLLRSKVAKKDLTITSLLRLSGVSYDEKNKATAKRILLMS